MFRVLVMHVTPAGVAPHPDEVLELLSEFTFLDNLLHFDLPYEFEWVKDRDHHAELIVY